LELIINIVNSGHVAYEIVVEFEKPVLLNSSKKNRENKWFLDTIYLLIYIFIGKLNKLIRQSAKEINAGNISSN